MQFFRLGFFWCVLLITILGVALQGNAQNYQVHSIYMYSFMKYIQWPTGQSDDFTIAVLGPESPIIPHLESMATSKKAKGKPIRITILDSPEKVGACQMLFVSMEWSGKTELIHKLADLAKTEQFLMLTENAHLTGLSHINFIKDDSKVVFELNRKRIELAGMDVSTELLSLAKIVDYQE